MQDPDIIPWLPVAAYLGLCALALVVHYYLGD
jgi:hypothetical protein